MSIYIGSYPQDVKKAVKAFWKGRERASDKQERTGKKDQGNRGAVTGGKNMDVFANLFELLVRENGLKNAEVCRTQKVVTLPGYFRPTKMWDLLVMNEGKLIAVLELKSLCGPSFGNNANNRCEEALGSAMDFQTAAREGAFGSGAAPFLGYILLIEDHEKSRKSVKVSSHHFPVDPDFIDASYQQRMHLLCERMMQEGLYSSAAVIASPNCRTGQFSDLGETTSIKRFLSDFSARIAARFVA